VAAVLVDRQHAAPDPRQVRELARLRRVEYEGLVHHHVLAGAQRRRGQWVMGLVGRGDHHQIDVVAGIQRVGIGRDGDIGPVGMDAFGFRAGDGDQRQARHGRQHGRMESLAREAIADETDAE
jgi:hypothetical protein